MMAGMRVWRMVFGLCFAALAAGTAVAQSGPVLYRDGTLDELKGMRRFYVIASTRADRAAIAKRFNGRQGLQLMRHGTAAQFHITYTCERWGGSRPEDPSTIRLHVTIPTHDPITITWSKQEKTPTCKNVALTTSLADDFLKEFGTMNRGK